MIRTNSLLITPEILSLIAGIDDDYQTLIQS